MKFERGMLIFAEAGASALGFFAVARLAGKLGGDGFGTLDFCLGIMAWWLILVRGGFDSVLVREAARRPHRRGRYASILLAGRFASAAVAWLAVVLTASARSATDTASVCSLVLFVSAVAPDLAARVRGDTRRLALATLCRGGVLALAAWGDVHSTTNAAWAFVAAEIGSALVFAFGGAWRPRRISPRRLSRITLLYLSRSLAATSARFARVTLYALDLVMLGLLVSPDLGSYAAARRVLFAILGALIVLPSAALGPMAAEFRLGGRPQRTFTRAIEQLLTFSLPAAVGLGFTATRWMPILFGPGFPTAGPWLAWLAVRLPVLAVTALVYSALTAQGKDATAARRSWLQLAVALPLGVVAFRISGTAGLACALIFSEVGGLVAGVEALEGVTYRFRMREIVLGLLFLCLACLLTSRLSPIVQSLAGAAAYSVPFLMRIRSHSHRIPRPHFKSGLISVAEVGHE